LGDTLMHPCTMRARTPYEKHAHYPAISLPHPGGRARGRTGPYLPVRQRIHQQRQPGQGAWLQAGRRRQRHGGRGYAQCSPCQRCVRRRAQATSPAFGAAREQQRPARRDADARAILESELRKAEARHAELSRNTTTARPSAMRWICATPSAMPSARPNSRPIWPAARATLQASSANWRVCRHPDRDRP
jgi:hypothetical protein